MTEVQYRPTAETLGTRGDAIPAGDIRGHLINVPASNLHAQKVTVAGGATYYAEATAGTLEATAAWKAYKVVVAGGTTTVTWADGNNKYDNVATDLTALTYS